MATTTPQADAIDAFAKDFAFLRYRDSPADTGHVDEPISVRGNAFWTYCGPLIDPRLYSNAQAALPPSFHDFAAKTIAGPILAGLLPFLAYIKTLLAAKGVAHYMLTVRASTPTHMFDRARWHSDELFFAAGDLPGTRIGLARPGGGRANATTGEQPGTNWKICTTLLGPSTMFIPEEHQASARRLQESARKAASTDHDCHSIRCVGCASAADAVRSELDASLAGFGVHAAAQGECSVFKVGRHAGAVHSEPCMSEGDRGRIFVNVIPGTEDELRTLLGRWGMEFPRQWWLEVPKG